MEKFLKVKKVNSDCLKAILEIRNYQQEHNLSEEDAAKQINETINKTLNTLNSWFSPKNITNGSETLDYVDICHKGCFEDVYINLTKIIAFGEPKETPGCDEKTFPIYFSEDVSKAWWISEKYYDTIEIALMAL